MEKSDLPRTLTQSPLLAIEVAHLTKTFGELIAVNDISFHVQQGELFGFLGPNGAGKTTTISMLIGLARSDAGTVRIGGLDCSHNPKAAQHLIGIVPDESNLYPELTGFDNLCFCAALYGIGKQEAQTRARDLLAAFGLTEAADRKFATYSTGMKRKLTIAAGIIHRPEILFLDEPTTGIDIVSARQIRQLIANLHQNGTTIFLTTHYIEEAERLCDRIAFIVKGQIVRVDTVSNLLQPIQNKHKVMLVVDQSESDLYEHMTTVFPELEFDRVSNDEIRVTSEVPVRVGSLVRFVEDHGAEVIEARRLQPSLEEVFVQVTGIDAGAMQANKGKNGR